MNQIAIGDSFIGYTVIEGQNIGAPLVHTSVNFNFANTPTVEETLEIRLKGTAAQISTFLSLLETIANHAALYQQGAYHSPQYLRFQRAAGDPYFYTPIFNIFTEANPAGYIHQTHGSKMVILHYTRPNHFTGPVTELPLTGRAGSDITGGYNLVNHTDSGVGHGSTALIKWSDFSTILPAPLRIEYMPNTAAGTLYKDIFLGIYNSTYVNFDTPFFYYYDTITGGTNHANAAAISGFYKRQTWTAPTFTDLFTITLTAAYLAYLNGGTFRPMLRLFATHAYTDLYFKVKVNLSTFTLFESEAVYAPPSVGYVNLPPVDLPPNFLLREVNPAELTLTLSAWRTTGAAATVDADCITLFPLASSASFYGYYHAVQNNVLVDDSFRERYNIRTTAAAGESMGFARVGGPLVILPNEHARLFIYATTSANIMDPALLAVLKVYYYPRIRLL